MSEIEFHTGVADKLGFVCRLLRKAVARQARLVVHGDAPDLQRLDQLLWTFDSLGFVPHAVCRPGLGGGALLRHTPVWLCSEPAQAPHHDVLVSLGPATAPGFEAFTRVIEVVSAEPQDALAGRSRWKYYVARGYSIRHHEAGA